MSSTYYEPTLHFDFNKFLNTEDPTGGARPKIPQNLNRKKRKSKLKANPKEAKPKEYSILSALNREEKETCKLLVFLKTTEFLIGVLFSK